MNTQPLNPIPAPALTDLERKLFDTLRRNAERPMALHDIMAGMYGPDDATSRVQKIIDVMVHKLRKKLAGTAWCIETTRGFRRLTTSPVNRDMTQTKPQD